MKKLFLSILFLSTFLFGFSQININSASSGLQLAQKLLGNGVSISNVTYTGLLTASGTFVNINSPVTIDSGIVLTSGRALTRGFTIGVNGAASLEADNENFTLGDMDLNALITPRTTLDAAVLEFDFVPLGDTVSFNYVFSSEEYPEFVCSEFNDIFGFFISGPGIVGNRNMALIPGTNIPVSINTINGGVSGGTGGAVCLLTNTSLYVDNESGAFLTHNGLTKKLRAFSDVTPCQTYHLKIVIADVGDRLFDTGVFIEANSLNANTPKCTPLGNIDNSTGTFYLAEGCLGSSIKFSIPQVSILPTIVNIEIQGTAINGTDISTIPNFITIPANTTSFTLPINALTDAITESTEILKIFIKSNCVNNLFSDSAILEIRDYQPLYITPDTSYLCLGSSTQLLASAGYTNYTWAANSTLNNTTLSNPIATPVTDNSTYFCIATLGTCKAQDSAKVIFNTVIIKNITPILCTGINIGVINLELTRGWVYPVNFSINGGTPQADSNFTNLAAGIYTIVIKDNVNCTKTLLIEVPQLYPSLNLTETIIPVVCNSLGKITINGTGGLAPYTYSVNANPYVSTNDFPIVFNGNFVLSIKDANNCITTKNITIAEPSSLLFTTTITNASCNIVADGLITINVTSGTMPYQYSANGGLTYQSSNILTVGFGPINIFIKDANGCIGSQVINVPLNNTITTVINGNTTICEGTNTLLNNTSNADTYLWTPNNNINNNTLLSPTINPINNTKYYIKATKGLCEKTDSVLINVLPAPIVTASNDTTICFNDTILLNANGGISYNWQPNYNINNVSIKSPKVNPLTTTNYFVHTTDILGCKSLLADSVKVNVIPKIFLNAGNDTSIVFGQPFIFNVNTNATLFSWQPTSYLNSASIKNPTLNLPNNGDYVYRVKGFTTEGCFANDTIKFTVFPFISMFVPTVFTPNGDGLNDVLKIKTIGIKELRFFKIYNRWGNLVFETRNQNLGWNGTVKNKLQGTNTFAWTAEGVDFSNNIIRKNGTVTIIH